MEGKTDVLVLIPIHKLALSKYEEISLLQAFRVFKDRKICILTFKEMPWDNLGQHPFWENIINNHTFEFIFFKKEHFSNIQGYNKLLLSKQFYKTFKQFEYLLIYQLDCFVFKDDLDFWTEKAYDYIGAPWAKVFRGKNSSKNQYMVGNGGLSLRHIGNHIKVLNSFSYVDLPSLLFGQWLNFKLFEKLIKAPSVLAKLTFQNNTFFVFNNFLENEDVFWGYYANRNFKWFNVAPESEAFKFSFESSPRELFERNQNKLPFGCHAWWKYDLDFWKPFIQGEGYQI